MPVEFGLALPIGPKPGHPIESFLSDIDATLTVLGERLTTLWMTDHFFWDDEPTYEAWTTLTYLIARSDRTVGPMVLGQNYRNPALLAKMAATLASLSGGRFIMGIGAGWKEDEYHAYGYEYPSPRIRLEQLEDTLEILTRMWREPGPQTYHGQHYRIEHAYCEPKPPRIPIVVGGGGTTTMRLAARFADIWNIPDAPFERYHDRLRVLHQHCVELGRDPATLRKSWFGRVAVADTEAEALALGGGRWTPDNAFVGTPDQVVAEMQRFVAIGCDYFMIEILGAPNPAVLALVRDELLPRLV
jgi:alkanesulfonate monooxygenase SsuD/methylene tetrahydromethanopterin reductase-like flavin-dependent oxidoreductase (luciferase family)